jgi:hypothetical protein
VATAQIIVMDGMPEHGGKTLKTMVISAPNKEYTIDLNTKVLHQELVVDSKTGTRNTAFTMSGGIIQ